MKCQVDAIQWGGGSSRNFSVVSGSRRDSVGGGSSRIFLWSPQAVAIQWGGVVAQFFHFSGEGVVPYIFR